MLTCILSKRSGLLRSSVRYMSVINLSDQEAVEKFTNINSKSVLYFTAAWCGPCRTIGPIVEETSKTYPNVAFGKVDVDDNADASAKFQITSVPTFVIFEDTKAIHKFAGADPNQLEAQVKELDAK